MMQNPPARPRRGAYGFPRLAGLLVLLVPLGLVGCSSNSSGPPGAPEGADGSADGSLDAHETDATAVQDATESDGSSDGGVTAVDAGDAEAPVDASPVADGPVDGSPDVTESEASVAETGAGPVDGGTSDAGDGGLGGNLQDATDAADAPSADAGDSGTAQATDGGVDEGDDAAADASPEAGVSATWSVILANQGSACAACAQTYCLADGGLTCEAFGTAVAAAGPSAGTLRSTLCDNTLACLTSPTPVPTCYEDSTFPTGCYCGPTTAALVCMNSGPASDAQCATVEQDGLETTEAGAAFNLFNSSATSLGSQMADAIGECMYRYCSAYCFIVPI